MPKLNKVIELQKEFDRRLLNKSSVDSFSVPVFFQTLINADDDLIYFALGELGQKLKSFIKSIDYHHPDIMTFFDGSISDDHEFSQKCLELLKIGEFAKQQNLLKIVPDLGQHVFKESMSRQLIKQIVAPKNSRMYVRLLSDPQERSRIRATKKMQTIDLSSVFNKGEDFWQALPDNFLKFLRFDFAYKEDIENAEKKAARYEDLNCFSLAEEIRKSIKDFKEYMDQSYYGFNRITMTSAAVILAKSSGFDFVPNNCEITVSRKFFEKFNFDSNALITCPPKASRFSGKNVLIQNNLSDFEYQPRIYPLHELYDIASEKTKKILYTLETFPDAGNKPIFDHFGIITPSLNFPLLKDKLYTFLDGNGILQSYNEREDAIKSLDKILISKGYLHPIIIGERDGKCYFVCYFL